MEYYAKSKQRYLDREERNELIAVLLRIKEELGAELTETEKRLLVESAEKIEHVRSEKQKTLKEHLEEIVRCAEKFFGIYGRYFTEKEKQLILEACCQHDFGKANLIFQAAINPELAEKLNLKPRKVKQIPHGFLSGLTISKDEFLCKSELFTVKDFLPYMTAIYYHHDREDRYTPAEIKEWAERYYLPQLKEYTGEEHKELYATYIGRLLFRNDPTAVRKVITPEMRNEYLLIKGMLNKFDYAVSAGYAEAELEPDLIKKELKASVGRYLREKELCPAQQYMKEHKDENLIVVAPTGSGKTEAALLWLDGEKGFYTLPLKVSSNAIYKRIKGRYEYKNVAILHSDSLSMYLQEASEESVDQRQNRAKMLAWPVTVCTIDQLFKFVYGAIGTEIFAATLKYSKLVIDEIQSYSPEIIAAIIYGLSIIQKMGGRFAIITATFPPVLAHFMERYGLLEGKEYQRIDFSADTSIIRHKIEIRDSEMDPEELLEQGSKKKVLVICNTVKSAQKLYQVLESKTEKSWLLHSCFLRKDRRKLEEKIQTFSDTIGESGIWITTQIVEASLDIDFDVLHTEMCSADSLLQRMGRCNRKGKMYPDEVNCMIYNNRNGVYKGKGKGVYEQSLYDSSLNALKKYEGMIFTEAMKRDYINKVYAVEAMKTTEYYKKIEASLQAFDEVRPGDYTKEEANKNFRNIKSVTVVPESVYIQYQNFFEVGVKLLSEPHLGSEVKKMIRAKLEDLTMSISVNKNKKLPTDRMTIGQKDRKKVTDIHRTRAEYDFDEETCRGCGLLTETLELDTDEFML